VNECSGKGREEGGRGRQETTGAVPDQLGSVEVPTVALNMGDSCERYVENISDVPLPSSLTTKVIFWSGNGMPGLSAWNLGSFHVVLYPVYIRAVEKER